MPGRPRLMTLRTKTTAAVLLVAAGVLGVCHSVLVDWTHATYLAEARSRVESLAGGVAAIAEVPVVAGDTAELERLLSLLLAHPRVDFAAIRGADGGTLASRSKPGIAVPSSIEGAGFLIGRAEIRRTSAGGLDVFGGIEETSCGTAGKTLARIEVGYSEASLAEQVAQTQATPRMVMLGGCVAIGGMVWLIVGTWTRRLDRLVSAAHALARGDMGRSFDERRGDEIGSLSRAFERMRVGVCDRDAELRRFNDSLQDQVRERTHELEDALGRAEAANRAKSDFLANMSHEIRTPMTAILGFAEIVADTTSTPAVRTDAADTIVRSGRHLLEIINDILDFSKIEAGKLTVESTPTRVAQVVEDVASCLRPVAVAKGLTLEVLYETPVPRFIASDATRLRQILFNLVGNAVKFTSAGAVTIRVASHPAIRSLSLRVCDTGIGVEPEKLGQLFQPFTQGDTSMSRRFGGTGLGLAIAKRLCELLGGRLDVESTPGMGSTFTAVIALSEAEGIEVIPGTETDAPAAPIAPPLLTGVRILVAEDGIENQRLILHHLRKAGADSQLAENGRIAMEALERARRDGRPFDVVLLDMQMPVMDGYAVAAAIRRTDDPTPLVALTAHALAGDRERCLAAGCDDYLTKPIDRTDLLSACRRWADCRRRRAA